MGRRVFIRKLNADIELGTKGLELRVANTPCRDRESQREALLR
jgi:hypothetical protein